MLRYVDQAELTNQTVLLRVDFNVPLSDNGTVTDDARIRYALPTIQYLLDKKNRLIVISHLGKPEGRDPKLTLQPVIDTLQLSLPSYTVTLVEDVNSLTPPLAFADNEVKFLENIRFYPQEKKNDSNFVTKLASLADAYVNDAFSVCHRKDASIVGIPSHLPSFGGLQLRREITMLDMLIRDPKRPFLAILGGSKISTKLPLLKKLLTLCDAILIGGGMANTFLKAQGYTLGKSLVEESELDHAKALIETHKDKIILPTDVVVADERTNAPAVKAVGENTPEEAVYDIGPKTQETFSTHIARAKTILWNGPVGLFEKAAYRTGTDAIITAIEKNSEAFTVLGGGDTLSAVKDAKDRLKAAHISTGGGAMLTYIADGTLPGIEALKNAKR